MSEDNLMSRHDMGVLMNSALNDRFALEEAIQRVRELHTWVTTTSVYDPDHKKICAECSQYHDCEEWGLTTGKSVLVEVEYPCPTIKALDGEQA